MYAVVAFPKEAVTLKERTEHDTFFSSATSTLPQMDTVELYDSTSPRLYDRQWNTPQESDGSRHTAAAVWELEAEGETDGLGVELRDLLLLALVDGEVEDALEKEPDADRVVVAVDDRDRVEDSDNDAALDLVRDSELVRVAEGVATWTART